MKQPRYFGLADTPHGRDRMITEGMAGAKKMARAMRAVGYVVRIKRWPDKRRKVRGTSAHGPHVAGEVLKAGHPLRRRERVGSIPTASSRRWSDRC